MEIRTMFGLHEDVESLALSCFLKGLPSHVSQPIRQQAITGHVSMEAAADMARASMASEREDRCAAVAVGGARGGPGVRGAAENTRHRGERRPLKCYGCNEEGHVRAKCPQVECFKCRKKGHMAVACPGNKERE